MADNRKKNVIIGGGAVGAIAALNLEVDGLATVTVVLRLNFAAISSSGYSITSCDHGVLKGWKPSYVRASIPNVATEALPPYNHIVLTTKNIQHPAIPPLHPRPRPHPSHTTLPLLQNGLNIDRPLRAASPSTPQPSSVSLISSAGPAPGTIVQDDADRLPIGASRNPALPASREDAVAREFVALYAAGGKTVRTFSRDVAAGRWRKLACNACLGPICAVMGLDAGRVPLAAGCVEGLVRLAMEEIVVVAGRKGVWLRREGVVERMIGVDPLEVYSCLGMLADMWKGNFIEFENLLGEPLREGGALGVPMPTLDVLYNPCEVIQWRTKEAKGMVQVPPKRDPVKQ